jgi:microcystin-dependent protein
MGILWPHSNTVARTNADRRAPGALAYFFEAGTTTPRATYQDADLTTPHAHPVVADAYGRFPAVFIDFGAYRERVKTAGSTQLWDTDDIPNPAPFDDEVGVDEDALLSTGDVFFRFKDGARTGAVRANGRTVGSATSGATERANADCAALYAELYNALSDALCPVSGGRGANAAADFAANKTLTLPDLRGSVPRGLDTMGNGAGSRFDASVPFPAGNAPTPGSTAGANHVTLDAAMIPGHAHSFSATTGAAGSHSHTWSGTTSSDGAHTHGGTTSPNGGHSHLSSAGNTFVDIPGGTAGSLTGLTVGAGAYAPRGTDTAAAHTHTYTTDSQGAHAHTYSGTTSAQADHTHAVSGTSASTGGGAAHGNTSRSILGTWYIKL